MKRKRCEKYGKEFGFRRTKIYFVKATSKDEAKYKVLNENLIPDFDTLEKINEIDAYESI